MHLLRHARKGLAVDNAYRTPVRRQLRLARHGHLHAYRQLVDSYFDLVTEYLFLCNGDRHAVLHQAETVFREAWKRLPYLKRLSDWEHVIASTLINIRTAPAALPADHGPGRLKLLEAREKFALVAFDLERWSYYWLGLALRQSPETVGLTLFHARCRLLDFDPGNGKRPVSQLLKQVSRDLDGEVPPRKRGPIQQRLSRNPTARDFKSRWLDARCELIEMRQRMRFPAEDRNRLLAALESLSREEMMRPPLRARARNLVSFTGAPTPEIRAMPGRPVQSTG